jgi:hypothetical protein
VTVKDAICLMKNLHQVLTAQTSHPSIERRKLDTWAEPPLESERRPGAGSLKRFVSGDSPPKTCGNSTLTIPKPRNRRVRLFTHALESDERRSRPGTDREPDPVEVERQR